MYALIHPSAVECSVDAMRRLGYKVLVRNTPFDDKDIRKEFLREHIDGASCCGRKEFIKLYAYTLTNHPIAVILDLDVLILQPLDDLFDAMLLDDYDVTNSNIPIHRKDIAQEDGTDENGIVTKQKKKKWNKIDAFYTRDYNMVNPGGEKYAGVQGGFLMVKPSESTFAEYVAIVLEGDYRQGKGWGGHYGYFFGGMQIQGICAYYYEGLHPNVGVELNRCRINSMVDNPHFQEKDDNEKKLHVGKCRDGRSDCEDCRSTNVQDVLSVHFTLCGKPWDCQTSWGVQSQDLCLKLHTEWFRIRRNFEESRGEDDALRELPDLEGAYRPEHYFGYCTKPNRYLPIKVQ